MPFLRPYLSKYGYWFLLIPVVFSLSACRHVPTGAAVAFVGEPAPGLVTVAATGRGTGLSAIEQDAVRTTLETLLFVGVPGSTVARIPLADPQSVPPDFVAAFVRQGSYQPFFSGLDRPETRRRRASGGGRTIRYTLTVNQDALRRHLEQQGIVRKLGY